MAERDVLSECCTAPIDGSLSDGVLVGHCSKCSKSISRINPVTGKAEWLDGKSPWDRERTDYRAMAGLLSVGESRSE
jgi:hypothetical protein